MTVEVQSEATQVAEVVVPQEELEATKKVVEERRSNFLSDLKENEKKALNELKSKVEEAILGNTLFKKEETTAKKEGKGEGEIKKDDEDNKVDCQVGEDEENPETNGKGKEEGGLVDVDEVDKEISIWGVPLLPSKGDEKTNVVLLKFLRTRDYKVNESFEMLKKMLEWRKEFNIQSILEEDLGSDLAPAAYMSGIDNQGHPICYNIFGVLDDEELYNKKFGTEEKRNQFLRWRVQLMEKGIQQLDFKAGGVSSLLQINDLKNSPGPSKKEVRVATKQAVDLLQDNYPEFVAKNIFINVPFWYYAVHSLLSPFPTQRTKSKFVFARPAKVTETLLIGTFQSKNDFEFSVSDCVTSEILLKAGSTETIEIPAAYTLEAMPWHAAYEWLAAE
ncbi:hypothetical protein RND71_020309 [Anisodus tanguticus]|uniref:CRAL-TRIO domain-containing protein n=1 Tax=Anisodus tanguticus TaxID=243964 RepID=A0AAE1VA87_9SOLA|nr:hypothetical protein RND71_020309 [Anisodus tanguticus]